MNETIQKLKDDATQTVKSLEEKLDEAKEWASVLANLVQGLPENMPFIRAHPYTYKGKATLVLEVDTLGEARAIMEALKPVPAVIHKDSCTSIVPASEYAAWVKSHEGETLTPIYPVWLKAECITSPCVKLEWYTDVRGVRCKVDVKIKQTHYIARWTGRITTRCGEVVMKSRGFSHKLTATNRIKWWTTPENHQTVTLYWDQDTQADVFAAVDNWSNI